MSTLPSFKRNSFTYLSYGMLAFYAYAQASFGLILPFLKQDFQLSFMQAGLYASTFAIGMILAGALGDAAANWLGKRRLFWFGGTGMALGIILLISAPNLGLSLLATLIMGTLGSFLLVMIQSGLADAHKTQRAQAFLEANIFASLAVTLLPLLVGTFEASFLTWRGALGLAALVWLITFVVAFRIPFPTPSKTLTKSVKQRLPFSYWLYWLVLFFCVCAESSLGFWTPQFLATTTALSAREAAFMFTLLTFSGLVGRIVLSRLVRIWSAPHLLIAAMLLLLVSFPLVWLTSSVALKALGLGLSGFAIASLFPLGLSVASTFVSDALQNQANVRITLAPDLAILLSPPLLGFLADTLGLQRAFGSVLVFTLAALCLASYALHQNTTQTTAQTTDLNF